MDSHINQGDLIIPNTQGQLGTQVIPASIPRNIYEPRPLNLEQVLEALKKAGKVK